MTPQEKKTARKAAKAARKAANVALTPEERAAKKAERKAARKAANHKARLTRAKFKGRVGTGWKRDSIDNRDYRFVSKLDSEELTPIDLRPSCPSVFDQGNLGSCTACATTTMVQFVRRKQNLVDWAPSPLFTYYTTRKIEKTVKQDSGATVRNALKSTVKYGTVNEQVWPYNIVKFKVNPPPNVYIQAELNQTLQYFRLNNTDLSEVKQCLAEGFPFTFGIFLYESFDTDTVTSTGIVPKPNRKRELVLGGHCMLAVGWELINDVPYIIVQNSWGVNWGINGFCKIPAAYLTNPKMCVDFWTIRQTE